MRHTGTHEKLPSLGALRAGAEFCLSWLRANYWRPQRLTIGAAGGGTRCRFIRKASDVKDIRKELGEKGNHIKIVSKVTNDTNCRSYF